MRVRVRVGSEPYPYPRPGPGQADAQLAQLARAGHVSVVVTEDSDLLAFGKGW